MTDDELIDRALAAYSTQEPLAGIEQRVIGRIGGVRARRVARWWMTGAVAAMAMFVIAVHTPVKPVVHNRPPQVREAAVIPERPAAPLARRVHRASARKARPFPSPLPLTEDERAMLAFVEAAPEQALQ